MNKKSKLYDNYNYEDEYDKKIKRDEAYEDLRINNNYVYIRKTIRSGNVIESEIYPVWKCKNDLPRGGRKGESREVQKRLNKKNSIKNIIRLVNTNFKDGDLYMTLTYKDRYLPSKDRARKDIRNFIDRVKRWRKKNGLTEEFKYIYALGYEDNPGKSKKVRIHHHIILTKMDRDAAEKLWKLGRAEAKRLQSDEFQFEGVSRYIGNQGEERIAHSQNLKKPTITIDRTTLTRRKAEQLAFNENDYKDYFENKYKGAHYLECDVYKSDDFPGVYFYAKLKVGRKIE